MGSFQAHAQVVAALVGAMTSIDAVIDGDDDYDDDVAVRPPENSTFSKQETRKWFQLLQTVVCTSLGQLRGNVQHRGTPRTLAGRLHFSSV
jgi:hypothetical protein